MTKFLRINELIDPFLRAALFTGAALFIFSSPANSADGYPMTGYVGVLGSGQYQGIREGGEAAGGARLEFTRLVKFTSLDLRYAAGKYTYMGGALRFFQHWETAHGNHYQLGGGPGASYAPKGNFYGNSTQYEKPYLEYFVEGFGGYIWDFHNSIGLIFQAGVQFPFHRKYYSTSASPNNAGYLKVRPFVAMGMAFDVD